MGERRFSFIFVAQPGELALKAALLAASLRRYLKCNYELVAAVPGPAALWGTLSAAEAAVLAGLGARLAPIENPFGREYPIGNKIAAMGVAAAGDRKILMDSDILLTRAFGDGAWFDPPFAAKPVDMEGVGSKLRAWRKLYKLFGLAMPAERVVTTVDGATVPPYFNAGFVAADAGVDLGGEWMACARRIDRAWIRIRKRPWLDQLALPIAVAKLGLKWKCLPEELNYPAHLKRLPAEGPPWFVHYHGPDIIGREAALTDLVRSLVVEHGGLREMMAAQAAWRALAG